MKTAIIGTAGRDKTKKMTLELWNWMLTDAKQRIPLHSHIISGGAAWADHLAIALYLDNHADYLTLHLPAPFKEKFIGEFKSAGSAANYYHQLFSKIIGEDTISQIKFVIKQPNVSFTTEDCIEGYGGMFKRNDKVATADNIFAYTFGKGNTPADGGTLYTWNKCKGNKIHITLPE